MLGLSVLPAPRGPWDTAPALGQLWSVLPPDGNGVRASLSRQPPRATATAGRSVSSVGGAEIRFWLFHNVDTGVCSDPSLAQMKTSRRRSLPRGYIIIASWEEIGSPHTHSWPPAGPPPSVHGPWFAALLPVTCCVPRVTVAVLWSL